MAAHLASLIILQSDSYCLTELVTEGNIMHRIKIKTGTGSTHSQNTAVSTTFKNSALNFPDFPNDIIATETDTTKEWTALANRSAALISQNKGIFRVMHAFYKHRKVQYTQCDHTTCVCVMCFL